MILLVLPLTLLAAESIKNEALQIFNDYLKLHEELKAVKVTGAGEESHQFQRLKAQIDSVHQYVYLRTLRKAKDYMVDNGDTELLNVLFKVIIATSYRSDDYQLFALGDIYLAQSDSVVYVYRQFEKDQRKILYQKLEDAFVKVSFRNKEVPDYEALREKLIRLQNEYE
jgi:hypothetical protein